MESGEGIERIAIVRDAPRLVPLVESGEGIESVPRDQPRRSPGHPRWNPVKELKVESVEKRISKIVEDVESGEGIES